MDYITLDTSGRHAAQSPPPTPRKLGRITHNLRRKGRRLCPTNADRIAFCVATRELPVDVQKIIWNSVWPLVSVPVRGPPPTDFRY